jgi:hypothetical protein
MRKRLANPNARTRVAKDEDDRWAPPSCFETHRSALSLGSMDGHRAAMLLSMGRRDNLWMKKMMAQEGSLFPACSLQGAAQLRREWRIRGRGASPPRRDARGQRARARAT